MARQDRTSAVDRSVGSPRNETPPDLARWSQEDFTSLNTCVPASLCAAGAQVPIGIPSTWSATVS